LYGFSWFGLVSSAALAARAHPLVMVGWFGLVWFWYLLTSKVLELEADQNVLISLV